MLILFSNFIIIITEPSSALSVAEKNAIGNINSLSLVRLAAFFKLNT